LFQKSWLKGFLFWVIFPERNKNEQRNKLQDGYASEGDS